MPPTIGRIVIFHDPDFYGAPHPAIITRVVNDVGTVDLTSFPPGLPSAPHTSVKQVVDGGKLTSQTDFRNWCWPERID